MTASIDDHRALPETATHKVATKTGDDTQESPTKKRKIGLTLAQKQAMIDNLQMESRLSARSEPPVQLLTPKRSHEAR